MAGFIAHLRNLLLHFTNHYMTHTVFSSPSFLTGVSRDSLNSISQVKVKFKIKVMLQLTVSRPVCLEIKHPSRAYDQTFITFRQFQVCWRGALSLRRGRVCPLQLLLALASAVILGSKPRGTRDYILLSQIRDFPFLRLLRLAVLQWRYLTQPPHGIISQLSEILVI
jgi:hypothetical protein